jgi:hypothetical protein
MVEGLSRNERTAFDRVFMDMGEFAAVIGTSLPPDGVVQLPIKVDGPEVLLLIMKHGHDAGLSHEELVDLATGCRKMLVGVDRLGSHDGKDLKAKVSGSLALLVSAGAKKSSRKASKRTRGRKS